MSNSKQNKKISEEIRTVFKKYDCIKDKGYLYGLVYDKMLSMGYNKHLIDIKMYEYIASHETYHKILEIIEKVGFKYLTHHNNNCTFEYTLIPLLPGEKLDLAFDYCKNNGLIFDRRKVKEYMLDQGLQF